MVISPGFCLSEAFTRDQAVNYTSPGQFHCWAHDDGSLTVERADPVVWCTGQLLVLLHLGTSRMVSFECRGDCEAKLAKKPYIGDVIRIDAGRRYVYVVTRLIDEPDRIWEARWPD